MFVERLEALFHIVRTPSLQLFSLQRPKFEALMLKTERDFHVRDYIREPDEKPGKGKPVDLRPTGWLTLIREQLGLLKRTPDSKQLVYLPVHKLALVTGSRQAAIA